MLTVIIKVTGHVRGQRSQQAKVTRNKAGYTFGSIPKLKVKQISLLMNVVLEKGIQSFTLRLCIPVSGLSCLGHNYSRFPVTFKKRYHLLRAVDTIIVKD